MYCWYRSSGLRAPAARQTRGVFHGLEPMKKRMICCTSILKVHVGASSPPVCPHSPMPGWSMKKGLFRSEVVVFISEIVFVFSEVVSFISEVDKTCVEVQVSLPTAPAFSLARACTLHTFVFFAFTAFTYLRIVPKISVSQ